MNGVQQVRFHEDVASVQSVDYTSSETKSDIRAVQEKKQKWYSILVAAAVLPLICLCGLMLYQLIRTAHERNDASRAKDSAQNFISMDATIRALQSERGMTSRYLGSSGAQYFQDMMQFRQATDERVEMINFSLFDTLPNEINTKSKFKNYLGTYREQVNELVPSTAEAIGFYTELIGDLIDATGTAVQLPADGDIWRMQGAAELLLRTSEPGASQTSAVRTFGFTCELTKDDMIRYQNLDGAVTALTRQAFTLHPPLEETYNQHVQKNDLLANWEETRQIVVSSQFKEICMNISEVDRRAFGFAWFQNFRQNLFLVAEIRTNLTTEVIEKLDQVVYDKENLMIMEIILFLIIAGVSLVLVALKTRRLSIIVNDLIATAIRDKIATGLLQSEKRKADRLLYSMMPAPVAEELKTGRDVIPQYYDSATLCYIDIVNFVSLISDMQPIHVTKLLNAFYKMFDRLIDVHRNVHKTEQCNDVYSVVSGVPDINDTHSRDVANFVIDLLQNVARFKIEDLTSRKLQVRAGVHTGPCAAGVVGHKVLRYSVFGRSVKIASRMSRYSEVQRIQISEKTKNHLLLFGDKYLVTKRGEINVFGMGKVQTYYLNGHKS